jgi:hypothetical protein
MKPASRITGEQKKILKNQLRELGILKDHFEFLSEEIDCYRIKFKRDYFEFHLQRKKDLAWQISILDIHHPESYTIHEQPWDKVLIYYSKWAKQCNSEVMSEDSGPNVEFPKIINTLSPRFQTIFNQALQAENLGLNEITGMGYRKALEFLVKDYCCNQFPEEVDEINRLYLKPCILKYIKDEPIKALAERAAYLGNDHSHYLVIWTEKTLQDLKVMLLKMVDWIEHHTSGELIKSSIREIVDSMPLPQKQ